MKAPTCTLALAACLLLPATSQADDTAVEQTFRAFSQCDAAFFASLHTHAATWQNHASLAQGKNISWISVRNRALANANSQPLLDAPQVGGLTLLSYFDTFDDLAELGRYLFWGFIVDGPKEQVARGLRPYIARQEQLQSVNDSYVRAEERLDGRWESVAPEPGKVPGTRVLERVLILEPYEDAPRTQTRVSCTLQGAVDGPVLEELRPDIPPAEYPLPLPFSRMRATGPSRTDR